MASEIMKGTGVVHGITNSGSAITMSGYATFILQTAKLSHKFQLDAVQDEVKFDASLIATNAYSELTITWKPSGATRAAAATTAALLSPLATVALANFKVSAFNGNWIYVGDESIDLAQAAAGMEIKVRKYDDSTQNTSLNTTVSG